MYIWHAVYVQGGKKAPSSLISPLILVDKTDWKKLFMKQKQRKN